MSLLGTIGGDPYLVRPVRGVSSFHHHEHRSKASNQRSRSKSPPRANLLYPRKLGTPLRNDPSTVVSSPHNSRLDFRIHCDRDDPIRVPSPLFQ